MRKLVLSISLGLSIGLSALLFSPIAHADVNDFTVTKFDADYTLTNSDHQGTLHVVEHIYVSYTDFNHGILRALPDSYKNHRLQLHVDSVSSDSGAPAKFTTYGSNGNTVLKIGDPKQTVTANQEYNIDYTVRNVIGFYADHDELYWNINGDQWDQPFNQVSVQLHLPSGLNFSQQQYKCYAGGYGSLLSDCQIDYRKGANELDAVTLAPLRARQTLSIVAGFDKGYFQPSKWYETLAEYTRPIVSFFAPFLLLAGTAGVIWFKRGRDAKGRGTIIPEYDAPDDLKPIEVGTIIDFKTDNRDLTATIIDLAIKRYITIVSQKIDRKLLKDTTLYSLRLERTDVKDLGPFEIALLESLFDNFEKGEEIDLSALKYKLNKTAMQLRKDVNASLISRGYFRNNPNFLATSGVFGTAVAVVVVLINILPAVAPGAVTFGIIAGLVLAGAFVASLPARTAKGVEAKEHILGLKMYMEVAEKDRIAKLQSPDAPYAPKSAEPRQTVDLFEKLLPYAMALKVEEKWAEKFKDIYKTPPDWYSGNWSTFNTIYFASVLNSGIGSAVNTTFSAPRSSGGSGFGGGAGGGGGGGGGGGW